MTEQLGHTQDLPECKSCYKTSNYTDTETLTFYWHQISDVLPVTKAHDSWSYTAH